MRETVFMALKAGQTLGSWTFMKGLEKASQGCLKYSEQFGLVHFNGLRRPPLLVDLHLVLGE